MSLLTKKLLSFNPSRFRMNNIHSNSSLVDNCTEVINKNPRNLELMRIARKSTGWHLERVSREFWNQLVITRGSKHVEVHVEHSEDGPIISASTKEWPLKKRLYSTNDSAAYLNLGRVLAERCLESGLIEIHVCPHMPRSGKIDLLLSTLKENGIELKEPKVYKRADPWDLIRYEKPWEVHEP